MTFGSLKLGFLHGEQPNLDVDAKREIPFSKTVGGRESRSEELRCGRKHARKLTLTLCGFLQCSLSTPSTVMLLGRITTSLLLSLHVSSHSSPRCHCVSNRGEGENQKQGNAVIKFLDLQKHPFNWNLAVWESSVWCIFNSKFNCTILKWT